MIPTHAMAIVNTILLLATIVFLQDPKPNPGKESWIGKKIIPTTHFHKIRFGDVVNGTDEIYEFHYHLKVAVEKEYLDWVRIDDGYHKGWVNKKDFVTIDRAVEYWSGRIEQKNDNEIGYFMRALSWMVLCEYAKAIDDYKEYYRINRWDINALANMGYCRVLLKHYDEAIHYFDEYLKLRPNDPVALAHRARAWFAKGEYQKAHDDFRNILPNKWSRMDQRDYAWMLATTPVDSLRDGKQSVELMKQVIPKFSLSQNWIGYDTLAAGQAECSDFEAAIRSQMTAIVTYRYSDESNLKWRSECYPRLVQYLCYKPYRAKREVEIHP